MTYWEHCRAFWTPKLLLVPAAAVLPSVAGLYWASHGSWFVTIICTITTELFTLFGPPTNAWLYERRNRGNGPRGTIP